MWRAERQTGEAAFVDISSCKLVPQSVAVRADISKHPEHASSTTGSTLDHAVTTHSKDEVIVRVIASQIRKGNVVEVNGQLYVVLTADNFHPGKGTPTTQIDMRRIADGVKVSQRYKTTEQVERAFIDQVDYQFLFDSGDNFTFMHGETFDQVEVPKSIVGDMAPYLQDSMTVKLSLYEGTPVSIELPQRVTLEVV